MDCTNHLRARNIFCSDVHAFVDGVNIISWSRNGASTDVISYRDRQVEMKLFNEHPTVHLVSAKWVALGGGQFKDGIHRIFGQIWYTFRRLPRFPPPNGIK